MKKLYTCLVVIFLLLALMLITGKPACERVEAQKKTSTEAFNIIDSIALGLLIVYQEYETECYNDSTYNISPLLNFVYVDSVNNWVFMPPDSTWTHRHPTFPGFMEFLEKKYEVEK